MNAEDLTEFSENLAYIPARFLGKRLLNIGWLSSSVQFTQGELTKEDKDVVLAVCATPFVRYRSLDPCRLGCALHFTREHTLHGQLVVLGGGICGIPDDKVCYIFPDLLYHYCEAHQYLPPPAFLEAARRYVSRSISESEDLPSNDPLLRNAIADVRAVAEALRWPWREPVKVTRGIWSWTIVANAQGYGSNQIVAKVRKKDGLVTSLKFLP